MSSQCFEFLDLSNVTEEECTHLMGILELSDNVQENVIFESTEARHCDADDDSGEAYYSEEISSPTDVIHDETYLNEDVYVKDDNSNEENMTLEVPTEDSMVPGSMQEGPEEPYSLEETSYYMPAPEYSVPTHIASVGSQPLSANSPIYIPPNQPHSPNTIHSSQMYHPMNQPPPAPQPQPHMVQPTFYVENCQINLSPLQASSNGLYQNSTPSQQVYNPYIMNDPSMPVHLKHHNDKLNYAQPKLHESNRGQYRGRGTNRRRRDDHERSNSISSDHSSYSDSGAKSHFSPAYVPMAPLMPYPVNPLARAAQGVPLMQAPQFIPNYSHPGAHYAPYSQSLPVATQPMESYHSNVPVPQSYTDNLSMQDQMHSVTAPTYVVTRVTTTSTNSNSFESEVSSYTNPISSTEVSHVIESKNAITSSFNSSSLSDNVSQGTTYSTPKINNETTQSSLNSYSSTTVPDSHTEKEKQQTDIVEPQSKNLVQPRLNCQAPSFEPSSYKKNVNSDISTLQTTKSNETFRTSSPEETCTENLNGSCVEKSVVGSSDCPFEDEYSKETKINKINPVVVETQLDASNSIKAPRIKSNTSAPNSIGKPRSAPEASTAKPKLVLKKSNGVVSHPLPEIAKTAEKLPKVDPSPPEENTSPQVETVWGNQKKSWSQLFKPSDEAQNKQIAYVMPFKESAKDDETNAELSNEVIKSNDDISKRKIGGILSEHGQDFRPVSLQPRGLINKNYWCYVNAPLQALLYCPSFYQLMQALSKEAGSTSANSATPFINGFVDFIKEFNIMAKVQKASRKEKNSSPIKEPEIVPGSPFEPMCVYKVLVNHKENQFIEGRQQDAEEMLSCVLNGLHDEMVESLKLTGSSTVNGISDQSKGESQQNDEENSDEWKVQGPKKKSCITRTAHFSNSPISEIFWGQLRSVLQQGGGTTTANLQPFNSLPLDIQSTKVDSLKDALLNFVTKEEISGMTCPKTNQEVTATAQVWLEDLPRVLILQLKRFIYDKDGGLQKVTKRLLFPTDLEITKDLLSFNSRGKFSSSQRKYKLFAVVNHEGKEATKGHYVSDIYHPGYGRWLRCDDSNIVPISEAVVLKHDPPRVPYLLFYRRCDSYPQAASSQTGTNAAKSRT